MSFARRLSIPVSNDTLLRAVRKRGSPSFTPPVIIGIDDWAWRRNHRYGTLICDLERRKTIALLPDRGGRLHLGMVAGIKSERWPTSNRNPRKDCVGIRKLAIRMVSGIQAPPQVVPVTIGIADTSRKLRGLVTDR